MHKIPFAALVPHDDNRIGDVTALRQLFQEEEHIREPLDQNDLMFPDATILEVLIGLAKRATFMVGKGEGWWFDLFIKNLGLVKYNDIFCTDNSSRWIVRVLDKFNNREYKADGTGGLFPLKIPNQDQRQVELWYQMGAYMTENLMY